MRNTEEIPLPCGYKIVLYEYDSGFTSDFTLRIVDSSGKHKSIEGKLHKLKMQDPRIKEIVLVALSLGWTPTRYSDRLKYFSPNKKMREYNRKRDRILRKQVAWALKENETPT